MDETGRDKGLVVKFTNIDSEDFTHSYDGYPWTIKAGESQFFPVGHARLFAKHLAQKMIMKRKKASAEGKMDGTILFKEHDMDDLKNKILSESHELPQEQKSPQEVYRERVKEINETLLPQITVEDAQMTKAQLIVALKERGEKVDVKKSKDELFEQWKKEPEKK